MPVSFRKDSQRALIEYRQLGYHIEVDLVPDAFMERILATALEHPNAKDGNFRPIPMPHRERPNFLEMTRFPPIVAIVEIILGGTASGLGGEFFFMKPGTPGWVKHQDNFYVQAPPDAFVSVWTALTDVDNENGALTFFPGSHKLGELSARDIGGNAGPSQNPAAQGMECIMPETFPSITMKMRRGSTAFFHSQLVHQSNENKSNRFRYSYLATYLRKGAPFRPGTMQRRTEVDLHG
jgi:non-heme Fe2+,alpha-ketoglutarate-dependent halogenase